jgi:hypothetical protein
MELDGKQTKSIPEKECLLLNGLLLRKNQATANVEDCNPGGISILIPKGCIKQKGQIKIQPVIQYPISENYVTAI